MTRKQSLKAALHILQKHEQTDYITEISKKLQALIEDLPITNWTQKTIFDTFEQFLIDNGRNATTTDMKKSGLPPHTVIKHRFGMDSKTFLDKYFPPKCNSRMLGQKYREEWLKLFKNDYERIKPRSAEEYNKLRQFDLPTWGTVARLFGIGKWSEFQKFCELPIYDKKQRQAQPKNQQSFHITMHLDLADEYANVCQRIELLKRGVEV